jgi:histidinol dehydrogenase
MCLEEMRMAAQPRVTLIRIDSTSITETASRIRGASEASEELSDWASDLFKDVRARGDTAVLEYERRFDGVKMQPQDMRVQPEEVERAYDDLTGKQIEAMERLKSRVTQAQEQLLKTYTKAEFNIGKTKVTCAWKPLDRVGCYIPGGRAVYPSTVLMTAVPAKTAGVKTVVICTPPTSTLKVPSSILVAADMSGVDEVYRIGGGQAIAAMALGTETIRPVQMVVGPGNRYVTACKREAGRSLLIDSPAGPTELVIYADGSASARLVALDLIAQAEHGDDSLCGLITTSQRLAEQVRDELESLSRSLPRFETIVAALSRQGFIAVCPDDVAATELINELAPEHLQIVTKDLEDWVQRVPSAGLVLLGHATPASFTDYVAGVSHVLPTGSYAKTRSGLTALSFLRPIQIVKADTSELAELSWVVNELAVLEGLTNHWFAIKDGRLGH